MEQRKQNRLDGYDYSQEGVYYVTICTANKERLLWETPVGERNALPTMTQPLSKDGAIVQYAMEQINVRYSMVVVDKYVIMPNHIHALIHISPREGSAMRSPTVSTVVNQMKGYVTKRMGKSIWQRSFYDHIIRDEQDYLTKWNYIDQNPLRWVDDEYYI